MRLVCHLQGLLSEESHHCPTNPLLEEKSYANAMAGAGLRSVGNMMQRATLTAKGQRSEATLLRHALKARTRKNSGVSGEGATSNVSN
jgi:hypothetical protein